MPQIGFNTLFICIFSIIFVLSCISLFFTERKKLIIPYMILILGYIFLVFSSNLVLLFLGIALSSYGAYSYLGRLHNHYLWS
jgi:NADH:ubiquinone oxidoreductase subunit 2 (subunit N)